MMQIMSTILGAVIVTILYCGAIWVLDRKISLQTEKKKSVLLDKIVLLVGFTTFSMLLLTGWHAGQASNLFGLLQDMTILCAMSILTITDIKARLIPNRVLLIFGGLWVMIDSIAVICEPEYGLALVRKSLIGATVGGTIFLLCYILSRKQLGAGDVKLAFLMGLYLTGQRIVGALAYGILLCCVYSLIKVARKKLTVKDGVPLAPFLYVGTLLTYWIL